MIINLNTRNFIMNLNIDKKRNDYASLSSKLNSKNLDRMDFTTYYK